MVAVVTDHWALLSPHLEHHNETCEAAHFGLWRICTTRVAVRDKEDKNCKRITLSGGKFPVLSPSFHFSSFQDPKIRCLWEQSCCQSFLHGNRWERPEVIFTARIKVEDEGVCLQDHLVRPGLLIQCRLLELRDSRNCWSTRPGTSDSSSRRSALILRGILAPFFPCTEKLVTPIPQAGRNVCGRLAPSSASKKKYRYDHHLVCQALQIGHNQVPSS